MEINYYSLLLPLINVGAIVLQIILTKNMTSIVSEKAKISDLRGKIVSDAINGIKMIKFNAWENILETKIDDLRKEEKKLLFKIYNLNAVLRSFQYVVPTLSNFIILYFLWLSSDYDIALPLLFTIMNVVNNMSGPLAGLTVVAASYSQSIVGSKRLTDILKIEQKPILENNKSLQVGEIYVEKASFTWDDPIHFAIFEPESAALPTKTSISEFSLHISPGEFIGIIGEVGSGKSSFLLSLMGELTMLSGSIMKNGSIAYVPQESYLINETLKNNVIFGNRIEERRYKDIIKVCELDTDIHLLPSKDKTEIGERGINLSGGQKQRISIARAVYSDSDIIIIDDALSALDADVGESIMNNLFLELLKSKTRIMVTHKLSLLDKFDRIIFLRNGKIHSIGTLIELASNKEFSEFISKSEKIEDVTKSQTKRTKKNQRREAKVESSDGNLTVLEDSREGQISFRTLLYYMNSGGLAISITSITFFFILSTSKMWLDGWIGNYLNYTFGLNSTLSYKLLYILLIILFFVVVAIRSVLFGFLVTNASYKMCKEMISNIIKRPMSYFDTTPSGILMNRCTKDVLGLDDRFSMSLLIVLNLLVQFSITFVIAIFYTKVTVLFAILFIWVIYDYLSKYLRTSIPISRLVKVVSSPMLSRLNEMSSGSVLLRHFDKQNYFYESFKAASDLESTVYLHDYLGDAWIKIRLEYAVFGVIAASIISLTISKSLGLVDEENVVNVGILLNYLLMISGQTNMLMFGLSSTMKETSTVERIQDFIGMKIQEDEWVKGTLPRYWPSIGEIKIDNLNIQYREGLPFVLSNFSLHVKSGEKMGLIGRTGSGKSTLFLALYRIMEASNEHPAIIIDGYDIRNLGLHELRKQITIIPQEPFIMEGTVKSNVDPFDEYTHSEILECLEKVGILYSMGPAIAEESGSDFSFSREEEPLLSEQEVPQELSQAILNFKIQSRGVNISSGQKQLISIARAVLKKPKILLMDEATANIDEKMDEHLQSMFKDSFKHSTIITIAHRTETLATYDRIAVIDTGKVVRIGTPNEIFAGFSEGLKEYL